MAYIEQNNNNSYKKIINKSDIIFLFYYIENLKKLTHPINKIIKLKFFINS